MSVSINLSKISVFTSGKWGSWWYSLTTNRDRLSPKLCHPRIPRLDCYLEHFFWGPNDTLTWSHCWVSPPRVSWNESPRQPWTFFSILNGWLLSLSWKSPCVLWGVHSVILLLGSPLSPSNSAGLWQDSEICISNKFWDDTDSAGRETGMWQLLCFLRLSLLVSPYLGINGKKFAIWTPLL